MEPTCVTLSLDAPIAAALTGLAHRRGLSVDGLAHALVVDGLSQAGFAAPQTLARRLASDFDKAGSWPELQGRLRLQGFDLRGPSGDLRLVEIPSGETVCALVDLDVEEAVLVRRMGCGFPATSPRWDWDLALDDQGGAGGHYTARPLGDHAAKR